MKRVVTLLIASGSLAVGVAHAAAPSEPRDAAVAKDAPSSQPAKAPPPKAAASRPRVFPAEDLKGVALRVIGARGGYGRAGWSDEGRSSGGVGAQERARGHLQLYWMNARYSDRFYVGGGSGGFEYAVWADLAFGGRLSLGAGHGPFARIGGRGHLLNDGALYSSSFGLPRSEAGYQLFRGTLQLEGGGHVGYRILGAYKPLEAERSVNGTFVYGAYSAFGWGPVRLDLDWTRSSNEPLGALDRLTAEVCVLHAPFALCIDGLLLRGDVFAQDDVVGATSGQLGVFFAVGQVKQLR
jgi:hypothetical protein